MLGRLKQEDAVFEATVDYIIGTRAAQAHSKILSLKQQKARYNIYL